VRVILFKGSSAYDALRAFTDDLAEAFADRGYEPIIVDAVGMGWDRLAPTLAAITSSGPVSLAFSFNIFGEIADERGRSIAELIGAPHVVQYVDYPLSGGAGRRLAQTPRSGATLVVDESHVDAIEAVYGPDRFAFVGFCPHAAIGQAAAEPEDLEAFADRPIPLLFCGTFYKPGETPWATLDAAPRQIMDEALEIALFTEWIAPMEALALAMEDNGASPEDPANRPFLANAAFLHDHVRAHRRFAFLNAVAAAGLPLHVYGKGYDQDLARFSNVTLGGEADFAAMIGAMRRSRVVANVNANFGRGSHERPLTAMLAGAAAASDHSRFYGERFQEGDEIMLYRWMALEEGVERLGRLVADPRAAHAMALRGQARVAAEHRSAHRVDIILAAAAAGR
jgi:hypothetical protein